MDIIGGIAAATEGLKLINELRNIDKEWDKAELKIQFSALADKLMDSKLALLDAQEKKAALVQEIKALKAKAKLRSKLEDENGLLYELDGSKNRSGEPFCNHCFVRDEKLFRMRVIAATFGKGQHYMCDNCKTTVVVGPAIPSPSSPTLKGFY